MRSQLMLLTINDIRISGKGMYIVVRVYRPVRVNHLTMSDLHSGRLLVRMILEVEFNPTDNILLEVKHPSNRRFKKYRVTRAVEGEV